MKLEYSKLGDYIQQVNIRNSDLSITNLIGVTLDKCFIPSVANIVGADMSKYKVIKDGQFACKLMSVGRDKKLPISYYSDSYPSIVSSAYYVFEIIDNDELLDDYLMMWFQRPETDRYLGFISGGDVRGSISWDDLCSIDINIPSIEKQQEIVKEYNAVSNRIQLNEQLSFKLEETAKALYKHSFIEDVDIENLPDGWKIGKLDDLCDYSKKRVSLSELSLESYISTENMLQERGGIQRASSLPSAKTVTQFEVNNILISNIRPYFKKIWLANFRGGCSNDVLCLVPKKGVPPLFLYQILEKDYFFEYVMAGSKGTKMPRGDKNWIMEYPVIIPSEDILMQFENEAIVLFRVINLNRLENYQLTELKKILLSKMSKSSQTLQTA